MKRAFILVEVSEESDEQLKRSVVIVRRSLHATQEDVGIHGLADLPYYEDRAPVWESNRGEQKRLSNKWGFFSDIFDALPGRKR